MGDCGGDGVETNAALTIQEASVLLRVSPATLRSWERRYGLPSPARTTGQHRRYTSSALNELRVMRDEIARGKRAGEAAVTVRSLRQIDNHAAGFVDRFLSAARTMNPFEAHSVLDLAVSELGLGRTLDEVLMAAMRRLGRWWETGQCDIAHEHLATEAVRAWLARITAVVDTPAPARTMVLACGPRDTHTLGLEAFAALLNEAGWSCRILGARTPATALLTAVQAIEPVAVVIVSHLGTGRRSADEAIRAVAGLGVSVFYSGNAYIASPSRRRLAATYLGDDLRTAASIIEATVRNTAPDHL